MKLSIFFLMFICYSFLGWLIEVIFGFVTSKKIVNRGFLIGPYCPIYGIGGTVATFVLTNHKDSFIILFGTSVFLFAILEYFTSYLMEKLFKARWWDYSNYRFNINGRICLEALIPFGLLGCCVIYFINPFLNFLITLISEQVLNTVTIVVASLFVLDIILSLKIVSNFTNTAMGLLRKDSTEEITKKVKETLVEKSVWTRRLIEAFPKVKAVISNINIDFIKTRLELNLTRKELKQTKKELKKERKANKKLRR